jgi:AbiJ N-terminal domain 4
MSNTYFSDREKGPSPRINEEIDARAWSAIVITIQNLIRTDAFAAAFIYECPDGRGNAGTDIRTLSLMIQAEIPELNWPSDIRDLSGYISSNEQPSTLAILDFIEFCYQNVAKPIQEDFHGFFGHYHLAFDREEGPRDFRQRIERIFARNGLAYELQEDGQIIRLAPPVLRETLQASVFQTGDEHLDSLLGLARTKYLNPDPLVRLESLEKLWDAWERLKTIEDPSDKRRSVTILLDKAATEPNFRARLESEAREITNIGNSFMIRHTETDKIPISSSEQVDYFFQRLFVLIHFLLQHL